MKNGFTLIETIVVIAILGAVSVLIGTNFFGLIGSADEYENENLYKLLNEAACVYANSKDKKTACSSGCTIGYTELSSAGYVDENMGLLKSYSYDVLKGYEVLVKVNSTTKERTCCIKGKEAGC